MALPDREDELLRSVALKTAQTVLAARERAERELIDTAEALRRNEARLRAIFNQAAVGIAITALDGRFLEMNGKFCAILGHASEHLIGRTFGDITHPDDVADTDRRVAALLEGDGSDFAVEKRYVRPDGSTVWSLTNVTLQRDSRGEPEQFIAIIEDITSRKDAESALREESRVLEILNETGTTLASQLGLEAVIQAVTDAGTKLSGARFGAFFYNIVDEESGDAFLLYTLSGAPREAFEKFGKPRATAVFGPTFHGEGPIRMHDVLADPRYGTMGPHHGMPPGHLPVRSYLAVAVRSRDGSVIGGLFFGHPQPGVFTERAERLILGLAAQAGIAFDNARLFEAAQKDAEERRVLLESERAARTEAERMSNVKDAFLATLSHELRTPLNAILGWSQILKAGRDQADIMRGLDVIERNARMQTQLIEDLLDMSRITSGKIRLDVQPIDPAVVIQAAVETLGPAADAKGVRVETLLDPAAGPIAGDPGRLQQIVWNLLSNAIKFTPRGGRIQLLLQRAGSYAEVHVADTGVGIEQEFIPHLFERFRQGDASTTRKYGGLGLGLSIVKTLVELHGGTVHVTSPGTGKGTTVTVTLPLTAVHHRSPGGETYLADPRLASVPSRELSGSYILVVDDQKDARELIARVLQDAGAEVAEVSSADEALAVIEARCPDMLISDIGMPDIDGFELIRRVRALDRECGGRIPAIALTAFTRSEDRTRALRAGFTLHVSKPVDPAELLATVASVAGRLGG